MNIGSVSVVQSTAPSATAVATSAEKPCVACQEEHREKHQERAGQASASYQLDPPATEAMRNLILAQAQEDGSGGLNDISKEEQATIDALKARDREVRDHEQAHARVGGPYAGEPSYTYQTGPDGNRYAIGGEVAIDVAPIADDPEATIQKMDIVKAAALAPAEPSGQDRKVAALADAQRMQAIADLAALRSAVGNPTEGQALDLAA